MPQLKSTLTRVPSNSHVLSSAIYMNIRTPEKKLVFEFTNLLCIGYRVLRDANVSCNLKR